METVPDKLVKDFNDTFGRTNDEWAELQSRAYARGVEDGKAEHEVIVAKLVVAKLPAWVSDLADARNQLHGIPGSRMASRTIRDVERAMARAAEAAGQKART